MVAALLARAAAKGQVLGSAGRHDDRQRALEATEEVELHLLAVPQMAVGCGGEMQIRDPFEMQALKRSLCLEQGATGSPSSSEYLTS